MIVRIDADDPRPIYVQIMDEIRRAIVVGVLRADEALPSVRQLSGELHVNPNTVVQAYRELERDGVVYVRRGQGTFVANSTTPVTERHRLLRELAARVLREAYRSGVTADELMQAMRAQAARAALEEDH
jgi:GntR family transcriptional regulator